MPLYYFHLRTPGGLEPDEEGVDCPDLETAYLEACRTIPSMAADLVRRGLSPMQHAFAITDAQGAPLLEVPFAEMLRDAGKPRRPPPPNACDQTMTASERAQASLTSKHTRTLIASVRAQVEALHEQMQRSRAIPYARAKP